MRLARRPIELVARLHQVLGTPGLLIGLFSLVSFGFGLLVLAREYDRLRRTGREALHRVVAGWVLTAPVDDLGLTLVDHAALWSRAAPEERESRRQVLGRALQSLGNEFDRQAERLPLIQVAEMELRPRRGPAVAAWQGRLDPTTSPLKIGDQFPVLGSRADPELALWVRYRAAPELERTALGLESSYRRLLLALLGLSGYSLLCLGYMVLHAQGLRDRVAREAASEATLDLADRTCHELGNIVFILANERSNLTGHLDLVQRFVDEEPETLRAAGRRAGLEPAQVDRLLAALGREHARRGLDPQAELRDGVALARDVCRQIAVCSEYIALTVRELDGYLKQSALPVAPEPVSVAACLDDALALLRPRLEAAGARVERPGPSDPPACVRADRRLLVHALVNLLKNAVEAASAADVAPRIALSVRADGPTAWIAVADNGPGIPGAARPRIFEPGFTTKGAGRGRGLAIVRKSIEAQGGRLLVDCPPAGGTVFQVGLPRARTDPGEPRPGDAPTPEA
ncbi:MAG TPA: ATP-binding protein [Isosphaeraceae bacterium]|jgi:signal transduction histidine kinase